MTIYLQSPDKTQIQAFINENQIGAGFIDWIKLTDKEITAYLLKQAKESKTKELESFYNSQECWVFKIYTQNDSLTRDANFFAKVLPACAGRSIQLLNDKNEIVNYNLTVEKASNLNYEINAVKSLSIKAKKLALENQIEFSNNIDDVNNIDCKNELLNAVDRNINLDIVK